MNNKNGSSSSTGSIGSAGSTASTASTASIGSPTSTGSTGSAASTGSSSEENMSLASMNPYVRYIGVTGKIRQSFFRKAYDHRLIYILEGIGNLSLETEIISLKEYDLVIIPPGVPYKVNSEKNLTILVINFDWTYEKSYINTFVASDNTDSFLEDSVIDRTEIFDLLGFGRYLYLNDMYMLKEKILELLSTFKAKRIYSDIILSGLFKTIIGLAAEYKKFSNKKLQRTRKLADELSSYLQEQCCENLIIESVAARFRYHQSHLNRILKSHFGVPIHRYILNCRMAKALVLLENNDYTIEDISEATGFCDSKHFSKTFTRHFGKSPMKVRQFIH